MKITDEAQVDAIAQLSGQTPEEVSELKRAIREGHEFWFFGYRLEAEADPDITEEDRAFCLNRFDSGESWAGILTIRVKYDPVFFWPVAKFGH